MKKFILIFVLIILFIFWGVNKYNSFKVIKTFQELNNPQASKILQEYLLKKTPNFNQIYTNFPLETSTHAVFFDLNNDDENEVIGFTDAFYSLTGYNLFILKNENDVYDDITYILNFQPTNIQIMKHKTNGFHDIKILTARLSTKYNYPWLETFKPTIIKFKNHNYSDDNLVKQLELVLKNLR